MDLGLHQLQEQVRWIHDLQKADLRQQNLPTHRQLTNESNSKIHLWFLKLSRPSNWFQTQGLTDYEIEHWASSCFIWNHIEKFVVIFLLVDTRKHFQVVGHKLKKTCQRYQAHCGREHHGIVYQIHLNFELCLTCPATRQTLKQVV